MKKIISTILAAVMLLSLVSMAGCTQPGDKDRDQNTNPPATNAPVSNNPVTNNPTTGTLSPDALNWKQFLSDYQKWVDAYDATYGQLIKEYKANPNAVSATPEFQQKSQDEASWTQRHLDILESLKGDRETKAQYLQEYSAIASKLINLLEQYYWSD